MTSSAKLHVGPVPAWTSASPWPKFLYLGHTIYMKLFLFVFLCFLFFAGPELSAQESGLKPDSVQMDIAKEKENGNRKKFFVIPILLGLGGLLLFSKALVNLRRILKHREFYLEALNNHENYQNLLRLSSELATSKKGGGPTELKKYGEFKDVLTKQLLTPKLKDQHKNLSNAHVPQSLRPHAVESKIAKSLKKGL